MLIAYVSRFSDYPFGGFRDPRIAGVGVGHDPYFDEDGEYTYHEAVVSNDAHLDPVFARKLPAGWEVAAPRSDELFVPDVDEYVDADPRVLNILRAQYPN
jgi:hypothetical protein